MKSQDAPPLTGPSELGTSITVTVSPDILTQDGSSQSLVTITAHDSNGKPLKNLSLRAEIEVGGVRTDFGSLSARNLVTDTSGRATLVYTSPAAPGGPAVDTNTTVSIVVTPIGSDFGNSSVRLATIRLVPSGVVIPADGLQPKFTFTPSSPSDHQTVLFDASTSTAPSNNPIVMYSWNFGDGRTDSGRTPSHSFNDPGTYVVTLTIADQFNRTASTSQPLTVAGVTPQPASFTVSPATPHVGENVNFNASASRPAPGRTIRSYDWDFGDGEQKTTTSPITSHDYQTAGDFTVTLVVTDDVGHQSVASGDVTVLTDAPTADFSSSPTSPVAGANVTFSGSSSSAVAGRTIVSWQWDFPGGTPTSGSGTTTTIKYGSPGTYNVTLTVTDSAGKIGRVTKTVTVQ
jgi:PKD repeat protein